MLIPEQLADGALAAMTQQFADVINAAGAPKGACLFASIAKARSIDLAAESARETTVDGRAVFFSPSISAVVRLIVSSRARPTPPPERCQVELLVGNPQDWDLLPRNTH